MDFKCFNLGDIVFYVKLNELTGTKSLVSGRVRTIYDKALILTDNDNNGSHVIDITESEQLFKDERIAKEFYATVCVAQKYGK